MSLHVTLRDARRRADLSQRDLAQAIGASQSAVSMFENGHPHALSFEKIRAAADTLGITLAPDSWSTPAASRRFLFCPVQDCPSHWPEMVSGVPILIPRLVITTASETRHCPCCGERLLGNCGHCNVEVQPGAHCTLCGTAYIAPHLHTDVDATDWVQIEQHRRAQMGAHLSPQTPAEQHTSRVGTMITRASTSPQTD